MTLISPDGRSARGPLTGPADGGHLTIDLGAVVENWRRMAARVAPAECAAAVKADAYGLGLAPVSRALFAAGARTFFVAHLNEGLALRAVLPEARIAVLNGLFPGTEGEFLAARLTPVLNDLGQLALWREAAPGVPACLHRDTGMNRLGLDDGEWRRLLTEPERLDDVAIAALMSHFACGDMADSPMTAAQTAQFRQERDALAAACGRPIPGSLANSAGVWRDPATAFDLARPGCALYGVNPMPERPSPVLVPVTVEVPILQVRTIEKPGTVGYGAARPVSPGQRIATLGVGYADGYLRCLGDRAVVRIAGVECPVIGRVSMDLITVDGSAIPEPALQPGGAAEILGPSLPPDRVAGWAGTIGYEILTSLGARYARRYLPPPTHAEGSAASTG